MKNQGSDGFMGEEYLTFEGEIIQFIYRFFQKIKSHVMRSVLPWHQSIWRDYEKKKKKKKKHYRTVFPMTVNAKSLIKQLTGYLNLLIMDTYKTPTSDIILYSQNRILSSYSDIYSESPSVVSDTLQSCGPWNSPGQNTGMGCLSLLQGIFPTQGSNPGLLHCRQILYQLSHQGSPLST